MSRYRVDVRAVVLKFRSVPRLRGLELWRQAKVRASAYARGAVAFCVSRSVILF